MQFGTVKHIGRLQQTVVKILIFLKIFDGGGRHIESHKNLLNV